MSEKIGPLTVGKRHGNPFLGRDVMEDRNYSEEIAISIDKEIRAIMDAAYDRAKGILGENRDKMDDIVKVLLEKETLEREEFLALLEGATVGSLRNTEPKSTTPPPSEEAVKKQTEEVVDRKPEKSPRLEPGMAFEAEDDAS